jgi:hypothetical protein
MHKDTLFGGRSSHRGSRRPRVAAHRNSDLIASVVDQGPKCLVTSRGADGDGAIGPTSRPPPHKGAHGRRSGPSFAQQQPHS